MNAVSFQVSKEDRQLISRIVKRAMALCKKHKIIYDPLTADMDLTACHCNGNPLDLERLLEADEFNFSHDVFGICEHIDRDTGQLKDCFVPRCSKP